MCPTAEHVCSKIARKMKMKRKRKWKWKRKRNRNRKRKCGAYCVGGGVSGPVSAGRFGPDPRDVEQRCTLGRQLRQPLPGGGAGEGGGVITHT